MELPLPHDQPIIFFDGVCNLCNSKIDYIIQHDAKGKYKFASLQSNFSKQFLQSFDIDASKLDTLVLFEKNCIYTKSEAVFKISKNLEAFLPRILYLFRIFPRSITDFMYDVIAKYRYTFVGKSNTCRIPSEEEKKRFLG